MADEFISADKEIESQDFRVPLPRLDSETPRENREAVDPKSIVACSNQQICEDKTCDAESLIVVPEKRISMSRELIGSDEDAAELLENIVEECYENSHTAKEGNNPQNLDFITHGSLMENHAHKDFLSKSIAKTEEYAYTETRNKRNHSQRRQIAEENYIHLPQDAEQNENKESVNQLLTASGELDAVDSGCTRTDFGKCSYSLYPQVDEGKYCSEIETGIMKSQVDQIDSNGAPLKQGKYFCYDAPLHEETGCWIPVSIPPMPASEHEEWSRGICSNGGYIPEGEMGWDQLNGEDKELTMWDVVLEMLIAAQGKVTSLSSADFQTISWISSHLIEQAWKEMAQTLTEANFCNAQEILEAEPPKWLPDSAASSCMLCSVRFHPIMCTRHHCRFCGGIFCGECTKGRSLLPEKFRSGNPERVCDVCCVRLESIQPYLMNQISRAAQLPTHDLTDLSTLRSWVNFPWGQSMEYEIYKATNTIKGYSKVGSLKPERKIPEAILRNAKGLAILTVVKVGMVVTYNIGTGLVIARKDDGTWSPPSAISSFGVGWGAQAGGELTDFVIVLRSTDALKTFCSDAHLSFGAGISAALGIVGRNAEADVRAGLGGCSACYTYSCSKGAFVGCSLEGSFVTTRTRENSRFYGSQSLNASQIVLGSLPRPPAAAILYRALGELYQKL